MANTTYVTFAGKAKWVRVWQPNKFDKWSLDLYLDDNQVERFKSYNTKNPLKKDDDGYYVTLSRPISKDIRGKKVGFNPPLVTMMKDGNELPVHNLPIGNGSDLTVTLEKYGYTAPGSKDKHHAIRLFSLRIDNLVPYNQDNYTEEEKAAINARTQQTNPGW